MIEDQFLNLLITEEIFILKEKKTQEEEAAPKQVEVPAKTETRSHSEVILHDLIIISEPLSDADKELLSKILAAIQFDISKVPIIPSLSKAVDLKVGIFFGKEYPGQPGLEVFKPLSVNSKTILKSPVISSFHGNDQLKRQLWGCLKQIFQNK